MRALIYSSSYQKMKEVKLTTIREQVQVSTSGLGHGLYFVGIKAGGKIIYKKLMIE